MKTTAFTRATGLILRQSPKSRRHNAHRLPPAPRERKSLPADPIIMPKVRQPMRNARRMGMSGLYRNGRQIGFTRVQTVFIAVMLGATAFGVLTLAVFGIIDMARAGW